MNKSISELEPIDQVNHDDILLISKKTDNGYVSRKINTAVLIEPALTAMNLFKDEQQQNNLTLQNGLAAITAGHKGYATLAAAQAAQASLPANTVIEVTNDTTTANNGVYLWDGATLTKSNSDVLGQSKAYTNSEISKIATLYTKNKYDPSKAVSGYRISGSGAIGVVAGAKHTGHIPVVAGQVYTMSWSNTVSEAVYYSFFANDGQASNPIASNASSTTSPVTFTVPSGANFIVVTLKHNDTATERQNFQLESGSVATTYSAYNLYYKANATLVEDLTNTVVRKDELTSLVAPMTIKPYDVVKQSKNLFNHNDLLANKFLSTSTGGLSGSAGWLVSGFIPVIAGQTYTLSGTRARQGISFFATNVVSTDPALLYVSNSALPLTVTAPSGANYAVIALESPTAKGYSNVQFEQGSVATEYMPYGATKKLVNVNYIDGFNTAVINAMENTTAISTSTYSTSSGVGSLKSGLLELGVKVFNPVVYTGSSVFNFNNDKYNGVTIRVNGDDTAPVRMMGATIGANHGYSRTILILDNHGKTVADVGSVWTDGNKQWVIIQIISASQLSVTSRSDNTALASGSTLTHVSGAINTASITPTSVSTSQWYPMLKNHNVKVYADDKQVTDTTVDVGFDKSLKIAESYDLMEKSDIVEWLILNGGKEVTSYNATSALNVSHVHSFNDALTDTIYANFFTYKALSAAQDVMLTQSARLEPNVDGQIKYYVPRSIPFTHESINFDFSKPYVVDDLALSTRINFDAAKTESGAVLPDRLIMLNNTIGYATGYLPILDAAPSVRNQRTSKGLQISNTQSKVYPYLVDGLTTLDAGVKYSAVAYRKYFVRPSEPKRTVQYDIPSDFGDYLYLDWHGGNFVDVVQLPSYMQGREFTVVEKTDNVTLLSDVATNQIAVKVGTVTSNARLVIKF